jgi:hypothetical protein
MAGLFLVDGTFPVSLDDVTRRFVPLQIFILDFLNLLASQMLVLQLLLLLIMRRFGFLHQFLKPHQLRFLRQTLLHRSSFLLQLL